MALAKHTVANREFFERGKSPTKDEWRQWVEAGIVKGKVIGDSVWIDLNWFAAHDNMQPPAEPRGQISGLDLLV